MVVSKSLKKKQYVLTASLHVYDMMPLNLWQKKSDYSLKFFLQKTCQIIEDAFT